MAPKKTLPLEKGKLFHSAERDISLYYEVSGPNNKKWQDDKQEILFLLLGSTADLRKTADQQYIHQSVGYFQILTYDHRNSGRSTCKDVPCTMEDYADDAAALLEHVYPDKTPVYVLGISFGGMVAQHLAIRHPHLIKKLVLCCCATGGQGGMSYPIHEWYEPSVTIEERVERRLFQANADRTPQWKERSPGEYKMVMTLLTRDEHVGAEDEHRKAGIARQLEARRNHNTWDKIGDLEMDVLVCGSGKDNITPVPLMQALAERIGATCEMKLDFDWGHPFIAADVEAMAFVNDWLRKPLKRPPPAKPSESANATAATQLGAPSSATEVTTCTDKQAEAQAWEVVGGADKGGIIVRVGQSTSTAQEANRLGTGSLLHEVEIQGERLHYRLLKGTGPSEGWVSLKLKDKDLVVKSQKKSS